MPETTPAPIRAENGLLSPAAGDSAAVSPTGTPLLSPKLVPFLVAAYGILTTVSSILAIVVPSAQVPALIVLGLTQMLATVLSMMSPGWRKDFNVPDAPAKK